MAQYINTKNTDADKQVQMRFPKGVDQVSAETALLPGAARRLVNFDVHQGALSESGPIGGRLTARSRVERLITGTRTHSLWSGDYNTCFVDDGKLYLLDTNMVATVVRSAVSDEAMYYTEVAGVVYYSNGSITGKISAGLNDVWGLPVPDAPTATAITFGGLRAGRYMLSTTSRDAAGQESGASPSVVVDVVDGGGIQLGLLTSGHITRVYVTPPNGENLYWAQDIPAGQTVSYIGAHNPGKLLPTQYMQPLEPCKFVESYNGRIYGAVGNTLIATQALNYTLTKPSTDFVMFPDEITMVKSVVNGVYVGTTKGVAYLDGDDLPLFRTRPADMLPPIPGSALAVDGGLFGDPGKGIVWLTRRGWVFGGDGGVVKRLTEAQMALPDYDQAASLYREHNGMRQVLSFVRGGNESAGASDSYDVEIVRNGRVL